MDGTVSSVDQCEQQDDDDDRQVRWPGLEGIMEAYQKYAEGTFYFSITQCNNTRRRKWCVELFSSSSVFPVLAILLDVMPG